MLNSSITPNILKINEIEACIKLAKSPSAKPFITDGKGRVLNVLDEWTVWIEMLTYINVLAIVWIKPRR